MVQENGSLDSPEYVLAILMDEVSHTNSRGRFGPVVFSSPFLLILLGEASNNQ